MILTIYSHIVRIDIFRLPSPRQGGRSSSLSSFSASPFLLSLFGVLYMTVVGGHLLMPGARSMYNPRLQYQNYQRYQVCSIFQQKSLQKYYTAIYIPIQLYNIHKVVDSVGPKLLVKRLVIRKIFLGREKKLYFEILIWTFFKNQYFKVCFVVQIFSTRIYFLKV